MGKSRKSTIRKFLALTPSDFNFVTKQLIINKSYQRIGQKDMITDPKTEQSNRTIASKSTEKREYEKISVNKLLL